MAIFLLLILLAVLSVWIYNKDFRTPQTKARDIHGLNERARAGDMTAAYRLAAIYPDETLAEFYHLSLEWALYVAKKELRPKLMLQIAEMYFRGAGTIKNTERALTWYERALKGDGLLGKKKVLAGEEIDYITRRITALQPKEAKE